MRSIKLAKRYAKGLLDYTLEQDKVNQVYKEIVVLHSLSKESKELQHFLKSPILDYKKKTSIASTLFASFSKEMNTFLKLLISQHREAHLQEITEQFILQYNKLHSIHKAQVISAYELSDSEMNRIIEKAKNSFNDDWTFTVENIIDPSILGGFILKVGTLQMDGSVKTKLRKLRSEFEDNLYEPKY